MIWLAGIGLILVVCVYLLAPFLARAQTPESITPYRAALRALPANADPTHRAALEHRLLEADTAQRRESAQSSAPWMAGVAALLLFGTLGIYSQIGAPDFTPRTPLAQSDEPDFDAMIAELEAQVALQPDDAKSWYILGRALVLQNRYDEGFAAYSRSLALDPNPDVERELASARTYAEQLQSGPSAADIEAAQDLSTEDQDAMIMGMVEGLRARLNETPDDVQGWTRLLNARRVLGQEALARADIEAMRTALPEAQVQAIVNATGWGE